MKFIIPLYLLFFIVFISCSSEDDNSESSSNDENPPVITIIGDMELTIDQFTDYIDPGATAVDDVDGDITSDIEVTINVNSEVPGAYTVIYNVSDSSGNSASATRNVIVAPSDKLTFVPDDSFEQHLIDLGLDDILDDYVITSNIIDVTQLVMNDKGISDLTGLQDFTNLQELEVNFNEINSIDVSQLSNLIRLSVAYNSIEEIDVSNNPQLEILNIWYNGVSSIDVTSNPLLTDLDISRNNISSIDLSQNINLDVFRCSEGASITELDLSNNPSLTILAAENAGLRQIIFPENSSLIQLFLEYNLFTNLDVSALTNLTTLRIPFNQLTSLNVANGNNQNWTALDAQFNFLDCIQIDEGFTPPNDGSWLKDPDTIYSAQCD